MTAVLKVCLTIAALIGATKMFMEGAWMKVVVLSLIGIGIGVLVARLETDDKETWHDIADL